MTVSSRVQSRGSIKPRKSSSPHCPSVKLNTNDDGRERREKSRRRHLHPLEACLGAAQESRGQWSGFSMLQGNMRLEKSPSDRHAPRPRRATSRDNSWGTKESWGGVTGQHAWRHLSRSIRHIQCCQVTLLGNYIPPASPKFDTTTCVSSFQCIHSVLSLP